MITKTPDPGFSLVELLVTMIIVSVGVLGVASLQIRSLQQNREAFFRAEASYLANGMMDRIRANSQAVYSLTIDETPQAATSCVFQECTSAQMAVYDMAQWQCSIRSVNAAGATYSNCSDLGAAGALPLGAGSVTESATTANLFQIEVRWAADSFATLCGSRTVSDPACQSIVIQAQL